MAASGRLGSTVRPCGRGEAREREIGGMRVPLPLLGGSAARVRQRGAVKRRRCELSKLDDGGSDGGSGARVFPSGGYGLGQLGLGSALEIGAAASLGVWAHGPTRQSSSTWSDSDSGWSLARGEDGPDLWGLPVSERKGEAGREAGARGRSEPRKDPLGRAVEREEERRGRPRLGRTGARKGRWAGPAGLGHKEKKKGKKKKKSGLAQPGIRGEKDKCFSNAFEFELKFKFKRKTINKTMQRA
jgi:hypothetical protein